MQMAREVTSSMNTLAGCMSYFPAVWDILAASSMATCCKASCSVARDDGRPNKSRACLAES